MNTYRLNDKPEHCDTCECQLHSLEHMHIYNGGLVCTECLDAFQARDNMIEGKISWVEHLRYCLSLNYKDRAQCSQD